MTATGHAVIGAALAAAIPNPIIGIPIAILSHLAADTFPHWDTGTNMLKFSRKRFVIGSFIDLGISLTFPLFLVSFLFPTTNILYAFCMIIAAQGLDWATAPYVFLNWQVPPFSWVYKLQGYFDNRMDKPWGIIGQVWILILLVAAVKLLR